MIASLLERLLRWLPRSCTFEFDGPVIVKDRGSWLRLEPGRPPRWFRTDWEAMGYA